MFVISKSKQNINNNVRNAMLINLGEMVFPPFEFTSTNLDSSLPVKCWSVNALRWGEGVFIVRSSSDGKRRWENSFEGDESLTCRRNTWTWNDKAWTFFFLTASIKILQMRVFFPHSPLYDKISGKLRDCKIPQNPFKFQPTQHVNREIF